MLRNTLISTIFISSLVLCLPARGEEIVLNFVGDIMLAGSSTATFDHQGYNYPFKGTVEELRRGDITVGNMEAPLARSGREFKDKKFRFKTKPAAAAALKWAGFSVLTLANNHMMDYGEAGLQETLQHLDMQGISHTGAGNNLIEARKGVIREIRGKKVAFLAYSMTHPDEFYAGKERAGTAPGYSSFYTEDIQHAKKAADYVIVSFHWGAEREVLPKPYQISAAHRAIDAGADIIIGHHPHVLQGIESYNGGIIFYSLGNFAFGSRSASADRSIIARIRLDGGIKEVEILPLNVLYDEVHYQPSILKGKRAADVISRLNAISKRFGATIISEGARFVAELPGTRKRLATR